ncbi:MAG: DNA polymerase III subunit gamma/tau [Candidatus Omnitrophota bacterium]|nr:DNA polymerase III subunit gamma/tau [Candidatus Omnitrophota bacterium]MDZ4241190.1 DNA polymerase III subunit gamma/tau [Candidatus Omnitrophota bacterium]
MSSYLVLARKHRPSQFDEVIGQDNITEMLKGAIASGRIAHAYLFCGPRGIGKTSCARILAKCLNCQDGPTANPCGKCPACEEITKGISFDVLEIDGASNRGIDEIRALRENVKFSPTYGRYKIYIIDEVHMLTTEAFNALLKTLEEPPPHVKFIFATTDPNKVPATIISRCQRFDFKRIPVKTIIELLSQVCKKEKLEISQDALYAVARASQGSLRDSLSILDQVSALSSRAIQGVDVYSMLGLVELDLLFEMTDALAAKDCASALQVLDRIIDQGKDIKQLGKDLVEHFRNLMVIKVGGKTMGKLVDYPVEVKERYLTQSAQFSLPDILKAIDAFIEAQDVSRITESLRIPLEIMFAKLTISSQVPAAISAGPRPAEAVAPAAPPMAAPARPRTAPTAELPQSRDTQPSKPHSADTALLEKPVPAAAANDSAPLDLESVKKSWEAVTYALSREKMSLATYLQEGFPHAVKGNKLSIGFTQEHEFHKETLENQANVQLVERIFSEKLGKMVILEYRIIEGAQAQVQPEEDEPLVKSALETFKGKIVSKWHNG